MAKSKKLQIGTMDYKQIYDWSGGMNDYINPALLNDNESARLENASLDEKGTLFPAKGSRTRFNIAFSDKGINGLGAFYKSDGTTKLLIGADNELYCDNPHIITTYDSKTDWDSGAKQNMVSSPEGDIKPTELQLPTFTRSSVAYLSNGTQVAANVPRFETGKFGQAIMVEEGTTNLLTENQSSAETDLSGLSGASSVVLWDDTIASSDTATLDDTTTWGEYDNAFILIDYLMNTTHTLQNTFSRDTTQAWQGYASANITSNYSGQQDISIATSSCLSHVTGGQIYTASAYAKYTSGKQCQIVIWWHDSAGRTIGNSLGSVINATGNWQRLIVTGTAPTDAVTAHAEVYFYDAVQNESGWWDGAQLEQKPYATSWTLGGSTRSAEIPIIPGTGLYNKGNWEFTVSYKPTSSAGGSWHNILLFLFGTDANMDNSYYLGVGADGNLHLHCRSNGALYAIDTTYPININNWYTISVTGNGNIVKLLVNGVKIGEISYVEPVGDLVAIRSGSRYDGVEFANGLIDDLRISSRARTDEEIAAAYNSGLPLPVDEWTAYKMNMDDNLLPAQRDITKILGFKPVVAGYNGAYWLMAGSSGEIKKYDGASTTDLSTTLGFVGAGVYSIAWNGTYWLIAGGSGKIKKYDGSTVTDLTSMFNFGVTSILTLAWNGTYWLIAGGSGKIKKYDGSTVTDLTSTFNFGDYDINSIVYDGAYFWVGGENGIIKKYNGATVTDLTSTFGFGISTINVINWNGSYFLIGADSGKIKKYDGSTVTDLTSMFNFGNKSIKYITWNGSYFLISAGTGYGTIKKYDGTVVTDISNLINLKGNIVETVSIFYSNYFILGTTLKTIEYYNFPDSYTYFWYSPRIDVSNAENKDIGYIYINSDISGGAVVTIITRSSIDGKNWSDWYQILSDGTTQHPAGNYIQIGIKCTKNKNYIPIIHKVVISFDGQAAVSLLASDFTSGGQFQFETFLDTAIIVNGIDAPRKYDGTTISLVDGMPPYGSYIAVHKNRLWIAKGSTIYFSEILDFETWDIFNFIQVAPNDGDTITGLTVLGDYLVIAKQHSIWLLIGDGKNTFTLKRIHSDRGCLAPRSLIVVDGSLCFVSDDGIYMSDLTQAVLISERIRNFWGTLNLRRLDICASYYNNHKLYVAVPEEDNMYNTAVIVFDTLRKCFVGIRRGWNVTCWVDFRERGKRISLFGHTDKGQVSEINVGYSDNGQPINFTWKSKEFDFDSPEAYKRWNKIYIDVKPAQYNADLTLIFFVDGKQVGGTSFTIPAATAENAIYSVLVLASKANVVGGRRLAIQLQQAVIDNPVGIHKLSIEYLIQGVQPTLYV